MVLRTSARPRWWGSVAKNANVSPPPLHVIRFIAPPPVPRSERDPALRARRQLPRELAGSRCGRGAGRAWRRAWLACLAYERTRYGFLHPESRFPATR